MMSEYPLSDLLMGIAQIAIAFVGFSAIVEVVRDRTQKERSQFENMLARTMIEFGFSALFLALVPLLVVRFSESVLPSLWPVLAGLGAAVLITHLAVYRRRRLRVSRPNFLMPSVYRIWASACVGVAAGLGSGTLGLLPADAVYVVGLVWLLVSGSISFVVIVSVLE